MTSEKLTQLSEEELIQEEKKQKSNLTMFTIFICLMTGVAIWSATHKGSILLSFLPLFLMSILIKLDKNHKAVKAEIGRRETP